MVAAAGPAYADDPKFDYGNYADVKKVTKTEWTASAEAGVVVTTGTTDSTTATGGFKVTRKQGDNKLGLEASGTYAKTGTLVLDDLNGNGTIDNTSELVERDQITAETLAAKARYDRFLTADNSLFIAALAGRDLPAGVDARYGGQAGYSRVLYKSKTSTTVGEIGYDFSREDLSVGPGVSVHSGRLFVGHKAQLLAGADLDASVEALTNFNHETLPTGQDGSAFNDTRVNVRVAISAKVSNSIAFQTSLESHFDNRPGPLTLPSGSAPFAMGFVPPAAEVETIMKVSLIYTFLQPAPVPAKK
ncbi:MAG TPA: DUF481 domain-containing protein [Kofleriaceae bacterium]